RRPHHQHRHRLLPAAHRQSPPPVRQDRIAAPQEEAPPMALISQPGSDYQIASISLDAGYTRDLILMLIDIHAVLDHLYLDGTQPQITAPAEDYLRESASPYTLPALIDALGEVTGQLSHAERQALGSIPPDSPAHGPAGSNP